MTSIYRTQNGSHVSFIHKFSDVVVVGCWRHSMLMFENSERHTHDESCQRWWGRIAAPIRVALKVGQVKDTPQVDDDFVMCCKFTWDHEKCLSSISHVCCEWGLYIGKRHHHNNKLRINQLITPECVWATEKLAIILRRKWRRWWMDGAHMCHLGIIIIDQWLIRGSQLEEMSNDYHETNQRTKHRSRTVLLYHNNHNFCSYAPNSMAKTGPPYHGLLINNWFPLNLRVWLKLGAAACSMQWQRFSSQLSFPTFLPWTDCLPILLLADLTQYYYYYLYALLSIRPTTSYCPPVPCPLSHSIVTMRRSLFPIDSHADNGEMERGRLIAKTPPANGEPREVSWRSSALHCGSSPTPRLLVL